MKLLLATLCALAYAGTFHCVPVTTPAPNVELVQDLMEFVNMIPWDKMYELAHDHFWKDEEFSRLISYMMEPEYYVNVEAMQDLQEFRNILDYLENLGFPAYQVINYVNGLTEVQEVHPRPVTRQLTHTGLKGFLDDLKMLLPMKDLRELYEKKMQDKESAFAVFVQHLSSKEFKKLTLTLFRHPKTQELLKGLKEHEFDMSAMTRFIVSLTAKPKRTRSLKDDLDDFKALIPVDKINDIFYEYLANDKEFQEFIDYILSDEITSIVEEIELMPEVKNFLDFLESLGIPAYQYVNEINEAMGINKIPHFFKAKMTGKGLSGFLKEIQALIPEKKLQEMYEMKMKSSKEFVDMVNRMKSKESQDLVDRLMANPKVKDILKKFQAKGIDVQAIFDMISRYLGLKFPKPAIFSISTFNLKDDLQDFMDIIPVEKMKEIFYDYLAEDHEFQEAVDYMMGDEFTGMVKEIEAMKEFKEFLNYLENLGLPAYDWINKMNDMIEIEPIVKPMSLGFVRRTGGLSGFLKDIKALMPEKEIQKMFNEKVKTSKAFAGLVEYMKSKKSQEFVNKVMAMPSVKNLMQRLEKKGVDVKEILDLITSFLGIKFPSIQTFALQDDLNDFWQLVPVDDIRELFNRYMKNDKEFHDFVDYMTSEEFTSMLAEVEALPVFKQPIDFLVEIGIPADSMLMKINKALGMKYPKVNTEVMTVYGVKGFFNDLEKIWPRDEMKQMFKEKMMNSKEFHDMMSKLKSPKWEIMMKKLWSHPKVNALLHKLGSKVPSLAYLVNMLF